MALNFKNGQQNESTLIARGIIECGNGVNHVDDVRVGHGHAGRSRQCIGAPDVGAEVVLRKPVSIESCAWWWVLIHDATIPHDTQQYHMT